MRLQPRMRSNFIHLTIDGGPERREVAGRGDPPVAAHYKTETRAWQMVYKVVSAQIQNDGSVTEGKRARLFQTPGKLEVGGLYFVRPGKQVRILAKVSD